MNLPEIKPYEEQAIDIVVSVMNSAKFRLGSRQTLRQLARSRNELTSQNKVSLNKLGTPLARTCESFIADTIERKWLLTPILMYILKYMGISQDECSQYYYYEMIFRIEGQHTDHDVRFVALTADWILAVLKMKLKFFERIEGIKMF